MAPPPGLFSMMTGWPRLSDNFCPYTRAMMSLPPPAVKPTTMWIGFAGYFAGSSWATAGWQAVASATTAKQRRLQKTFIELHPSKRPNMNMQNGSFAVIQRGKTAIDGGSKLVRLGYAFAVRAERLCHRGKIPRLALA